MRIICGTSEEAARPDSIGCDSQCHGSVSEINVIARRVIERIGKAEIADFQFHGAQHGVGVVGGGVGGRSAEEVVRAQQLLVEDVHGP